MRSREVLAPTTRRHAGASVSRGAPLRIPSLDHEWQHVDVEELLRHPALHRITRPAFPALGSAPAFVASARFLRIPLLQWHHNLSIACGRSPSQSAVPNRSNRGDSGTVVAQSGPQGDGTLYVGSSDAQQLFAIEADSGRRMWNFDTGGSNWSILSRRVTQGDLS